MPKGEEPRRKRKPREPKESEEEDPREAAELAARCQDLDKQMEEYKREDGSGHSDRLSENLGGKLYEGPDAEQLALQPRQIAMGKSKKVHSNNTGRAPLMWCRGCGQKGDWDRAKPCATSRCQNYLCVQCKNQYNVCKACWQRGQREAQERYEEDHGPRAEPLGLRQSTSHRPNGPDRRGEPREFHRSESVVSRQSRGRSPSRRSPRSPRRSRGRSRSRGSGPGGAQWPRAQHQPYNEAVAQNRIRAMSTLMDFLADEREQNQRL